MIKPCILVIGSNSFSGSNFVLGALKEGYKVIGVSRSTDLEPAFLPYLWKENLEFFVEENFNFYKVDINKELKKLLNLIDVQKPQFIVNFAAQGMVAESWLNPTHWYQTNLLAQVALHDHLRKKKFLKKYIHVTTPEVYGSTDGGWIKEKFEFNPSTPYAVSRAACDMHLISFYKAYDFPVIFTRAANVYGPGQQLYRIIPRSILSALTGEKLQLHGGGYSERCFIHINDVVKATITLMENANPPSAWHISGKDPISIRNLVMQICSLLDVNFEAIVEETDERLGKDQNYLLDSSKIRDLYKWDDKIKLHDGLQDTIIWVRNNIDIFKKLSWSYQHKL